MAWIYARRAPRRHRHYRHPCRVFERRVRQRLDLFADALETVEVSVDVLSE